MLPKEFKEFIALLEVKLDDLNVPFISYDKLIKNKSSTKRSKDKVDVEELEQRRNP